MTDHMPNAESSTDDKATVPEPSGQEPSSDKLVLFRTKGTNRWAWRRETGDGNVIARSSDTYADFDRARTDSRRHNADWTGLHRSIGEDDAEGQAQQGNASR